MVGDRVVRARAVGDGLEKAGVTDYDVEGASVYKDLLWETIES